MIENIQEGVLTDGQRILELQQEILKLRKAQGYCSHKFDDESGYTVARSEHVHDEQGNCADIVKNGTRYECVICGIYKTIFGISEE